MLGDLLTLSLALPSEQALKSFLPTSRIGLFTMTVFEPLKESHETRQLV